MGYKQLNFKDLKSRVGIDDLAFSLGYRLDRKAGLGRFIELVLPDGQGGKRDTIIISHPNEKAKQSYFRRSDGQNKDAIGFILENLHSFGITGRNQWDVVSKVLAKFANEPLPENEDRTLISQARNHNEFDPAAFDVRAIDGNHNTSQYIFTQRGLSPETVQAFSPWLVQIRSVESASKYYNIGFPYRRPGHDEVEGYEIRGAGTFKSKASGTNSSTAAWIVDFSKDRNPSSIRNVYFAESAFDIMAMFQANKQKLMLSGSLEESVFVSIGGFFSRSQVTGIMDHYKNARAVDCFDNDLAGRIYGIRMVAAVENLDMKIKQTGDKVEIDYKGKIHEVETNKVNLDTLRSFVNTKREYGMFKAPSNFKDWNDVILNKPMERTLTPSKYERDEKLEHRRTALKI